MAQIAPARAAKTQADTAPPEVRSRRRRSILSRGLAVFAVAWLSLLVLAALTAQWWPLPSYSDPSPNIAAAPLTQAGGLLGTDDLGRSMLSRAVFGARTSLVVCLVSVGIGVTVGGLLGALAGYFRGPLEAVINVVIDAALAFPPLVLLLSLTSVLTPSLTSLTLGLSVLTIPAFARLARANTLPLREREHVLAARAMGARHLRILFCEIVPGMIRPILAYAFIVAAMVIVAEGSLSFLGLGIPPPTPSWGGMIADGRELLATSPHVTFVPAFILLITVYSLNTVGDWTQQRAGGIDGRSAS